MVRSILLEERGRWCQGLAESMGTGAGVVGRGSKGVEREMNWRVDYGVGSWDAAVDEQCLWIANVADAVDQGLAGQEADDAGCREVLAPRSAMIDL